MLHFPELHHFLLSPVKVRAPASARLGRGADMKGPGPFMHPQSTELGFSTACTVKARFPTQR